MDQESAQEAAHALARAAVAGDFRTLLRGMTPDGLAAAMRAGTNSLQVTSYQLEASSLDGADLLFDVLFETGTGQQKIRQRLRLVDGAWKIVDVERI